MNARDLVVDKIINACGDDLKAFVDKPYTFVLPVKNEDGTITNVRIGITSCSDKVDIASQTMMARDYVPLERQVRSFAKRLMP